MTTLIPCHYISFYAGDLYNRRTGRGRSQKMGEGVKGKGVLLCRISMCFTENPYKCWTSNESEFPIPQISVYQSNWRGDVLTFTHGRPRQTYFAHSYLPRENQRSSACRGALLGATMSSSSRSRCWAVFPLKSCFVEAASEGGGQQARGGGGAFRTADSASARPTCARSKLSSRG